MLQSVKKYINAFSVSGCEKALASIILEDVKPYADSAELDPMGNLIVFKKGTDSSKRIMYAAHMDEIGFVVTHIDEKGYVRVSNIGGINPIYSGFGEVVFQNGTKGILVIEEQTKSADIAVKKLLVDIGAKNKKQAEKKVQIGDFLAVSQRITSLQNGRVAAKAFDDRVGCAILFETLKHAKSFKYDTYFVFTVQEEVGCRGSKAAANAILPDYGIAVDITIANDAAGGAAGSIAVGGGAAIKVKDSSVICSRLIVDRLTELAKARKIKYQYEVLTAGGTDTSSMQVAGAGCHAGCISLPVRYCHSPVELIESADLEACIALFTAVAEEGIE